MLAGRFEHRRTNSGDASVVANMLFVFFAEITDCAEHGIWRCLSQPAQSGVFNNDSHFFEKLNISFLAFTLGYSRQDFEHPFGAFTAGRAFTAGFILTEIHEEARHIRGALIFIHDNQSAGTHDCAKFRDFFIIDRSAEMLNGNTAAGGTAQLRGLEFFPFGNAAADIVNNRSQLGSHGDFHQTNVVDVAGKSENFGALAFFRADRRMPLGAA